MQIQFITNACLRILTSRVRILCDPWLVGHAFDGSWMQWPPLRTQPEELEYTHLYVSHIHTDHCDPYTLRRLSNKKAPVIIHKNPDGFVRRRIASCGFSEFIELANNESVVLNGVTVTMYEAFAPNPFIDTDVPNIIDSSIVVDDGTHRFLNINDNTPDAEACKMLVKRHGSFTGATVPYSGVGPWPSSYIHVPNDQKPMLADRKSAQYQERMLEVAEILKAEIFFPMAGQMILCGRQAGKNEVLGVGKQDTAADLLKRKGFNAVYLEEGDIYNLDTQVLQKTLPVVANLNDARKRLPLERYWWEDAFKVPPDEFLPTGLLVGLLQTARDRLGKKQEQYGFTADWLMVIQIDEVSEYVYAFSWDTPASRIKLIRLDDLKAYPDKYLLVKVPYNYLMAILTRHCHWNNAYHGCQVEWLRQPDDYLPELQTLFSYFHL